MMSTPRWAYPLLCLSLFGCTGFLGLDAELSAPPLTLPDASPSDGPRAPAEDGSVSLPDAGVDGEAPPSFAPGTDMCGDIRLSELVYYGTLEPTYLPMTPGQVLAVADLNGCSGLLINRSWVLTAEHCSVRRGTRVCFGSDPSNANICFNAVSAHDGPRGGDIALLDLGTDVTARIPEITPIPILMEDITSSWIGRRVEASGYGQTETGSSGTRKFTAQPISNVYRDMLTINGEGRRGVCFGDSGGPAMVIAEDGTIRTSGVLSHGDSSCVGQDNYTRVDAYRDWIVGLAGAPEPPVGGSCGEIDAVGRCMDGRALFCEDERLTVEACDEGRRCGWDAEAEGFRCILGDDPCEGLDGQGRCDGNVARWCEGGVARQRDCGACEERCGIVPEVGGAYCEPDPCGGLDYHGRCEGDVAVYCKEESIRRVDCAGRGQRCGWVNEELGYFCL